MAGQNDSGFNTGTALTGGASNRPPAAAPAPDPQQVYFNGSARDTNAAITRAQWEDYKARFRPLEGQLQAGLTFNPETGQQNTQLIGQNVNTSVTAATKAYDTQLGAQSRNLSRMGVAPDAEQQSSLQRASAISKAAAVVDAENATRTRLADRNQEIALGVIDGASGRSY